MQYWRSREMVMILILQCNSVIYSSTLIVLKYKNAKSVGV